MLVLSINREQRGEAGGRTTIFDLDDQKSRRAAGNEDLLCEGKPPPGQQKKKTRGRGGRDSER